WLRIDRERGKLLHAIGEVQVCVRIIGPPRIAGPFPPSGAVLDARESKSLPDKFFIHRPRRHIAPIHGSGSVVRATPSSKLRKRRERGGGRGNDTIENGSGTVLASAKPPAQPGSGAYLGVPPMAVGVFRSVRT